MPTYLSSTVSGASTPNSLSLISITSGATSGEGASVSVRSITGSISISGVVTSSSLVVVIVSCCQVTQAALVPRLNWIAWLASLLEYRLAFVSLSLVKLC